MHAYLYVQKLSLGHDVTGQVDGDVAVDVGDRELLDEEPTPQHRVVAPRGPVVRRKLSELMLCCRNFLLRAAGAVPDLDAVDCLTVALLPLLVLHACIAPLPE